MLGGGSHRSLPVTTAGSPLTRFVAKWSAEALMAELATCHTAEVVRTVRPQKCGQLTKRREYVHNSSKFGTTNGLPTGAGP